MSAPGDQTRYELFISYARKDNIAEPGGQTTGWVTAIRDHIATDHRRFSTEPLRISFDTTAIADKSDWRHRILGVLRSSKTLLVWLSPGYFASDYCRLEWDEHMVRLAHALPGSDESINAAWWARHGNDRQRSVNASCRNGHIAHRQPPVDTLPRHTVELVPSQTGVA
ncbi:hypothetical protein OKW41_008495 [Paraburkholderia sp. UCT70]|uniref:hypothetical protein n=1 Tax=Paraburkholderia sp. UCT70 TaxID=2991068 RepID=UPI003D1BCA9B